MMGSSTEVAFTLVYRRMTTDFNPKPSANGCYRAMIAQRFFRQIGRLSRNLLKSATPR